MGYSKYNYTAVAVLAFLFSIVVTVQANNLWWTGADPNRWDNTDNWNPARLPSKSAGDQVIFQGSLPDALIDSSTSAECGNLRLGYQYGVTPAHGIVMTGGTLDIATSFHCGYDNKNKAASVFTMTGGQVDVGGNFQVVVDGGSGGSNAILNVNGGVFNANAGMQASSSSTGVGIINVSGGTLNIGTDSVPRDYYDGGCGTTQLNVSSGIVNIKSCMYQAEHPACQSTITVSGTGILNVASNWFSGNTGSIGRVHVTGGTINIGNVMQTPYRSGSSHSMVVDGGTVNLGSHLYVGWSGTGTVQLNGGTVTTGGTVFFGTNGTMAVNSLGRLIFRGYDRREEIGAYIGSGKIYSSTGYLSVVFVDGNTVVTAIDKRKAWNPLPSDGAISIAPSTTINWSAGDGAVSHDVYIGTNATAVLNATPSTSGIYNGRQGGNSYAPVLAYGTTYYWRIDEVGVGSTVVKGDVWTFSTAPPPIHDEQLFSNVSDYTYMWWTNGFRDSSKTFSIQTSRYGLLFDFDNFNMTKFAPITVPYSEEQVLVQDNSVINGLSSSTLQCVLEKNGSRYAATAAGPAISDCMLLESGKYFQRRWFKNVSYQAGVPSNSSDFEISAWPDRVSFASYVTPTSAVSDGAIEVTIDVAAIYSTLLSSEEGKALVNSSGSGYVFLKDDPNATLICDAANTKCTVRLSVGSWSGGQQKSVGIVVYPVASDCANQMTDIVNAESNPLPITAIQTDPSSDVPGVSYDRRHGWYHINMQELGSGLDWIERVRVMIPNADAHVRVVRLNFAKEAPTTPIGNYTGNSVMLCDGQNYPTGIPVQVSKEWHDGGTNQVLFPGKWIHALTMFTVLPQKSLALNYTAVNWYWGGVPAVAHNQLCLIGWGGNQLWHESSMGDCEAITYDPDIHIGPSTLCDIRPILTSSTGNPTYTDGEQVGGGDFLCHWNSSGTRQFNKRMRFMDKRHGPCLTEVTYAGTTGDDKINLQYTSSLYRSDDVVRCIYKIRYDVISTIAVATPNNNVNRIAFLQFTSDGMGYNTFSKMARGDENGLIEEWTPPTGGNSYSRAAIAWTGDIPWFSFHEGPATYAKRGLVLRSYKAKLNGSQNNMPYLAVYGNTAWQPTAHVELSIPNSITQLIAGDYVEAIVEFVVMPRRADTYTGETGSRYYGPNANLKSALAQWGDTWRMIYREAIGNNLNVNVTKGQRLSSFPIKIEADAYGTAQFTVTGGLAYVPVTFTGLCNYRGFTLQRQDDSNPDIWIDVDQSVHGNDFWQTDYDPNIGRWEATYNINLDSLGDVRRSVTFRLINSGGFIAGDLNCNCGVDFWDMARFTVDWLDQGQNLPGDIDMDGKVNFEDYATLADNWLKEK